MDRQAASDFVVLPDELWGGNPKYHRLSRTLLWAACSSVSVLAASLVYAHG